MLKRDDDVLVPMFFMCRDVAATEKNFLNVTSAGAEVRRPPDNGPRHIIVLGGMAWTRPNPGKIQFDLYVENWDGDGTANFLVSWTVNGAENGHTLLRYELEDVIYALSIGRHCWVLKHDKREVARLPFLVHPWKGFTDTFPSVS